jgi:4-hydroxy-tetrahydrodipicolinate synthase
MIPPSLPVFHDVTSMRPMSAPSVVIEGALTALVTPFRNGAVDDKALTELVEEQIAAGIDGLVPVGTTGESPTLSFEEHIHVIAQTVKAARKRVPIVAGTGSNSTTEAIELSKAAREVGADALLHVTPYYNKPTQDGLVRHFTAIAEAVPLPIVVYNVPGRTACDLMPDTALRLCDVPNIAGIKEATGSALRATQIIQKCGARLAVLSGDDFTMFPLYAVGARGVISVVSNIAPRWVAEMWDAVQAGDWARARALHYRVQPLTELLFAETSPIPIKGAMALAGKMADEIRAPLYPLAGAARERMKAMLQAEGLL